MKKFFTISMVALAAILTLAGCKAKSNATASTDTIAIGGIFPLSGPVAEYGIEARRGVEIAIDEINAAGGVLGKQLVLFAEDDEGNPEKSVNAFNKLTAKNKVKIIVGSLTSGCTIAITSKAQAQKVVLIAPAATDPAVTNAGDFIFRACFLDSFQGDVGGRFAAADLGARQAAILYEISNDYSVGLRDNFVTAFQSLGGTIVANESYNTGDVDFNAQITKIKATNPDLVYLPEYYADVALIAKQLREKGINTPIVGGDGWDGLTKNAGDEVVNGFYSNHYAPDADDPRVQNFVSNFTAKWGDLPASFAALSYDSLYLIRDAVLKAGTADDSTAIKDALAATDGAYVTGHLSFDEKHNPVKSAVIVELVKDSSGNLASVYRTTVNP